MPECNKLIVPTTHALPGREDVVGVVVLWRKGGGGAQQNTVTGDQDRSDSRPTPNARGVDYSPYDAVLRHADILVSVSGLGGLQHAVAGVLLNKADIRRRVGYSGLCVDPHRSAVRSGDVSVAVDKVL